MPPDKTEPYPAGEKEDATNTTEAQANVESGNSESQIAAEPVKKSSEKRRTKKYKAKNPGFRAFAKRDRQRGNREEVKAYRGVNQAVEPTEGIHSQEWADAVAEQDSFLLKLPPVLRLMIFEYVFSSFNSFKNIEPHKRGGRFSDPEWLTASTETDNVRLICKQLYLDIDANGLLYKYETISFKGPTLLQQFLWAIKPSHKDALRSIHYVNRLSLTQNAALSLHKNAISSLAKLKRLQHLVLTVVLTRKTPGLRLGAHERWKCFYEMRQWALEDMKKCKELKLFPTLTTFRLEFDLDQTINYCEQYFPTSRMDKRVEVLEKDLGKIMNLKLIHDEVAKSNAMLRGLDLEVQAVEGPTAEAETPPKATDNPSSETPSDSRDSDSDSDLDDGGIIFGRSIQDPESSGDDRGSDSDSDSYDSGGTLFGQFFKPQGIETRSQRTRRINHERSFIFDN